MEAATGNVDHAPNVKLLHEALALRDIDARGGQQHLTQRSTQAVVRRQIEPFADLTDQEYPFEWTPLEGTPHEDIADLYT